MISIGLNVENCKGCGYCVHCCPQKAISFAGTINSSGYHTVTANQEACNGCGICYAMCPDCVITLTEVE
jgi:2-oxoglutarate ferredoxin oxidoreductase subunit delta